VSTILAAFTVYGRARTKGSLKVITPRGQKPRLIEDHAHSKPWRKRIVEQLVKGGHAGKHYEGAVEVGVTFVFERHGETSKQLPWPTLSAGVNAIGDLDKLLRNLLDALEDAKVIEDDKQVCSITTRKVWGKEAAMVVSVRALDDPS
jgi:Holliday junction resolvase RusA-like endonuclease